MAQASKDLINKLEAAHKEQFVLLVRADKLWLAMSKQFAVLPYTDKRKQALIAYGKEISQLLGKWHVRQMNLEKKKVPVFPVDIHDWFSTERLPYLESLVKKWDKEGRGLGFIPLLVWAVVAIIGLFTAEEVVDELNTTAEEKEQLMTSTADKCKELNLSHEECSKIIGETQEQASKEGGLTSVAKWGAGLLILGIVGPKLIEGFKSKRAAA